MPRQLPLVTDVVLMNAKPSIIVAQSVRRGRRCRYSHAALTLSHRSYLDSLTDGGVALRRWADLEPDMPFAAFRFRQTEDEALQRMVKMLDNYGKKYNFALGLKTMPGLNRKFDDALFCSELVAKVFERSELGLPENGIVMPSDLERLGDGPQWEDVTEIYRPLIGVPLPPFDNPDADDNFVQTALAGRAVREYLAASGKVAAQADELIALLQRQLRSFGG